MALEETSMEKQRAEQLWDSSLQEAGENTTPVATTPPSRHVAPGARTRST